MMDNELGMFAKHWRAGSVKTRLAKSIGDNSAARIYRSFVQTLITRLSDLADIRTLVGAPAEDLDEFQQLDLDNWSLTPQAAGCEPATTPPTRCVYRRSVRPPASSTGTGHRAPRPSRR